MSSVQAVDGVGGQELDGNSFARRGLIQGLSGSTEIIHVKEHDDTRQEQL